MFLIFHTDYSYDEVEFSNNKEYEYEIDTFLGTIFKNLFFFDIII